MSTAKASLICTLRNEADSIDSFLLAIQQQTRRPEEVVIVDGGSTDGTIEAIRAFSERGDIKIRLIIEPGCNIPQGRNIAIRNTINEVVASTDAGCKLANNWFEEIIRPFEDDESVDVVAGWYEPDARNDFEKVSAAWDFYRKDRILKNPDAFLPSSRSIAFKKKCWEVIGGYPEHLATAEDTMFDLRLKENGCKFRFAPEAVVFWRVRPTLKKFYRKVYLYRRGDGQAGLFMAKQWGTRMVAVFGAIVLLIVGIFVPVLLWLLLAGLIVYLLLPSAIVYRRTRLAKSFLYMPSVMVAQDVAAIHGYFAGMASRRSISKAR